MKRILLFLLVILLIAAAWGTIYLNEILLPTRMKAFIISNLEAATQKKVILGSVKFDIFKGLVLKDLIIHDDKIAVLNSKEVSCRVMLLPLLKKHIIIPVIRIRSPELYVERRADNTLNVLDPFVRKFAPPTDFAIAISRIRIDDGRVTFHDNTTTPVFMKNVDKVNVDMSLSLPASIKFNLKLEVPSGVPMTIHSTGEYNIADNKWSANVVMKDLAPNDFAVYYKHTGVSLPKGKIDAVADLKYAEGSIATALDLVTRDILFSGQGILATCNATIKAKVLHRTGDRKFAYSGIMNISDMTMSGIEGVGRIQAIKGAVKFNESSLSHGNVTASVFQVPVSAKIELDDFADPVMEIDVTSTLGLDALQKLLERQYGITIPANVEGQGKVYVAMKYKIKDPAASETRGSLIMDGAKVAFSEVGPGLEDVTGVLRFTPEDVVWEDLKAKYGGIVYTTSGTLTDFKKPSLRVSIYTKGFALATAFVVNNKRVLFSKFAGRYLNTRFSLKGRADIAQMAKLNIDMAGTVDTDMNDIKRWAPKLKERYEKLQLKGRVRSEFSARGALSDLRYCAIDAKVYSDTISFLGLAPTNLIIDYRQREGLGEVTRIHSFLYGGTFDASGALDLAKEPIPYRLSVDIQGVRIERLKADIAGVKDNDIAGALKLRMKLDGVMDNAATLAGEGKVSVTDGKLWQLNLFKGLGVLLFSSDFSNVVFSEGRCDFQVKDKSVSTKDLMLKSDLVNIYGSMKIDFDGGVNAELDSEFTKDAVDYGYVKKIGAAVGRNTTFVIKGTLKDPRYTMKANVANIIGGIASELLQ